MDWSPRPSVRQTQTCKYYFCKESEPTDRNCLLFLCSGGSGVYMIT